MHVEYWDNALEESLLEETLDEILTLKWEKHFKRMGSDMMEANDRENLPVLNKIYEKFSRPKFLSFIEKTINVQGIIPDPHMIGAGYSQIKDSGDLKPHVDFNWNDRIKLYRVATFIIYLNTPESGGEIEFLGFGKFEVKKNRAVIFEHSETIRHFVHPVVGVRNAVRFFYYSSHLKVPENQHRSLYGLDEKGNPSDIVGS
jgi:hypothetical protein